ncbi:ATP-dependent DNA ligase [Cellulomonas triticagri]|uniref:Probable DNA ligase n=1 Tax=Cellulomonas triticagri TaxID=2483352 RepID=A0A3M2J6K9_9CELL|nr:ATP-dependent DNA ligase [Cellulomonas triticagri]RMI09059.1 ATP-dependent DNA ligase [Cellulomonas triticagri]
MLLADVAATSAALAATRSRLAKRTLLVDLLRRTAPAEVPVVARYLSGELRQRRTGLGWRSLRDLPAPAADPTLDVLAVDATFERMSALAGPGSAGARSALAADLFGAATADEQRLLAGLVAGELRQGALDALLLDAVAEASGADPAAVRRAAMLAGATEPVAQAALAAPDPESATAALTGFGLTVGRPVRPMLAASAPDVATAVAGFEGRAAVVDAKLDGIRVQVHREGDDVRVFTRSLDDITARVPEVVTAVRALPVTSVVLDGEALALDADGRPRPFQETAARSATRDAEIAATTTLTPFFFDVLHRDGTDLLDAPLTDRLAVLDAIAPAHTVQRVVTSDPEVAQEAFAGWVAAGQEGVVVKDAAAPYEAGRRGGAWVKVKPRHTLDLVVLAVERGSGRRAGLLSNIHLGARDGDGGFVMLGKTFKGMTDEVLAWQTARFRDLETADDGWTVTLRPEQVVEIAFDGVQRSTRYPGGLALRFARVLRYREDKTAAEADTVQAVRALLPR